MLKSLSLLIALALPALTASVNDSVVDAAVERGKIGAAWESQQHADDSFAFYKAPANFSSSLKEGTLLQVEEITSLLNYTVPSGLTMSRIIYTTADLHGNILPTTAYVLWPYMPVPSKGYPMVAWAHGTSGTFRTCAPSNYRSLQYHFMVPWTIALQGMVVVAPDYAGLGIDQLSSGQKFRHPWTTPPAQANDLGNAIIAARSAFPEYLKTDGPFVAMGHSQGGGTAWGYAVRQAEKPIAGYQGTVVFDPAVNALDQIIAAASSDDPITLGAYTQLSTLTIDSVTATFPEYNYGGFTKTGLGVWRSALAKLQACLPSASFVTGPIQPASIMLKPDWYKNKYVQKWGEYTHLGKQRFAGPLLVLQGQDDVVAHANSTSLSVQQACNLNEAKHWGQSLEFVEFSAVSHFAAIQASQMMWLAWIKERLAGTPAPQSGCHRSVVNGFRTDAILTALGTAPNFFVEQFALDESWKYSL